MPIRSALAPVISVMSVHPVVISPDTSMAEARCLFRDHGVRHLLVADPERTLAGILSISDLAFADRLGPPELFKVAEFMTKQVRCLHPDDTVSKAIMMFLSESLHAIPVVDDGDIVGLVTSHDILRRVYVDILPLGGSLNDPVLVIPGPSIA